MLQDLCDTGSNRKQKKDGFSATDVSSFVMLWQMWPGISGIFLAVHTVHLYTRTLLGHAPAQSLWQSKHPPL